MSKQNLESASFSQPQLPQFKTSKRLPYRQPEVYSLGSLEQVQAYYDGERLDGPSPAYYYSPSQPNTLNF